MGSDKNGERRPRPAVEEPVGRIASGIQRVPAAPIKMSEKTENPKTIPAQRTSYGKAIFNRRSHFCAVASAIKNRLSIAAFDRPRRFATCARQSISPRCFGFVSRKHRSGNPATP